MCAHALQEVAKGNPWGFRYRLNVTNTAISGSLASDLIPIYNHNSKQVLIVLSELKFLVPATCYYFNKYFGFEGKNTEKKGEWLKTNKPRFLSNLGKVDGEVCLKFFK
ncbi:hypothetical protein MNBD_GAMMA19-392 [hydrothermal vent metagenome]|uniref:Uncharacterized protein n=1 Tax=hydrothermal vent metagenome TaxID=652676 RepID=A0A3B1AU28_9ZZZZ